MSCILDGPVSSNRQRKFVVVDRLGASHGVGWMISPICNADSVITGMALVLDKR
jgi:hypothetical protein